MHFFGNNIRTWSIDAKIKTHYNHILHKSKHECFHLKVKFSFLRFLQWNQGQTEHTIKHITLKGENFSSPKYGEITKFSPFSIFSTF